MTDQDASTDNGRSPLIPRSRFVAGATALGVFVAVDPIASAATGGTEYRLGNDSIRARFAVADGALVWSDLFDGIAQRSIPLPKELFRLDLADGTALRGRDFRLVSGPVLESLAADPGASRYAERLDGQQLRAVLVHSAGRVRATWRAVLRRDSSYLRQELDIEALDSDVQVVSITMFDFGYLPNAFVVGSVDGSPVVSGTLYAAVEHPFAQANAIYDRASIALPRRVPLRPGVPLSVSSVIGVTARGQMRRDFLAYVERERAHPYRTFLHYNSWYDLGYFTRYTADEGVQRIRAFGEALAVQRGARLHSFLFDDGWDDPNHLWRFNAGFPDGFAPLHAAAARYGAAPGAWLSPWGGYGTPRDERIASAKSLGFGVNEDGLALSAPSYYDYFESVVTRFIREGGVNQFKLDGTGTASSVYPGSRFGSDFEAAIHLIDRMRALEPGVYVNLTTGTYPSPYWLWCADSTWRGGEDHDFFGPGTHRQQWITYRDADTYDGVVTQGPLYPLNALMLHGLIFARHALHLNTDPAGDFRDEVRAYFGTGTQLQEMYVTPELLSEADWDALAHGARWSAANADVLVDTHWIGGDPYRLQIYGHASWSPRKGILCLRNPSDRAQAIALDIGDAFELPAGAATRYAMTDPWNSSAPLEMRSGEYRTFTLQPFEVLTLEAAPIA